MKINTNKGFTLIELLIVVAIIAILAAIAIPQFSAYRIRGFNAAATSDVRNIATAQEALFADTQGYGDLAAGATLVAANAGGVAAVIAVGPMNGATAATNGGQVRNVRGTVPFSVSNNVIVGYAGTAAANILSTYVLISKNTQGDSCYGRDSDSTALFRGTGVIGTAATAADVPAAAIPVAVDLATLTGAAGCTGAFAVM